MARRGVDIPITASTDRAEKNIERLRNEMLALQKQQARLAQTARGGVAMEGGFSQRKLQAALGGMKPEDMTSAQQQYLEVSKKIEKIDQKLAAAKDNLTTARKRDAEATEDAADAAAEELKRQKQMTTSILRLTAMMHMFRKWQRNAQQVVFGSARAFATATLEANRYSESLREINDNLGRTTRAQELHNQLVIMEASGLALQATFGELVAGPVSDLYIMLNQAAGILTHIIDSLPDGVGSFIVWGTVILAVVLAVMTLWISLKRIAVLLQEIAKQIGVVGTKAMTVLQKTQIMVNMVAMSLGLLMSGLVFLMLLFTRIDDAEPFTNMRQQLEAMRARAEALRRSLMGFDKLNILQEQSNDDLMNWEAIFESVTNMNTGLQRMYDLMLLISGLGFAAMLGIITGKIVAMSGAVGALTGLKAIWAAVTGAVAAANASLAFAIGMIVAGIAALVVGIVLLVLNWDRLSSAAKIAAIAVGAVAAAAAVLIMILSKGTLAWVAGLALLAGGLVMAGIATFAAPAMATGGVVGAPTMALVGEGHYPEAVVPLGRSPQFRSMKEDIAAAVAEYGGGGAQEVNLTSTIEIGGRVLDEYIERVVLNTVRRETGRTLRDLQSGV
jgi:hypothetical protein